MKRTDTERLDMLQKLAIANGHLIICRESTTHRGWRLHETSRHNGTMDIRLAIDKFLDAQESKVICE